MSKRTLLYLLTIGLILNVSTLVRPQPDSPPSTAVEDATQESEPIAPTIQSSQEDQPEPLSENTEVSEPPIATEVPATATSDLAIIPKATEQIIIDATAEPTAIDTPQSTSEPTVGAPSAPPAFDLSGMGELSVLSGGVLELQINVYDEQGAIVITEVVSTLGAAVSYHAIAPTNTTSPFITSVSVTYHAPEKFDSVDTLTFTAVDGAGIATSAEIQITIRPPVEATSEVVETAEADATSEPTVGAPSAPPAFDLSGMGELSVLSGGVLELQINVYDEQGAIVITEVVSTLGAAVSYHAIAPTNTTSPFITSVSVTYHVPEKFDGIDTLTLTAIDGGGIATSAEIQITIRPPVEATAEFVETAEAVELVERIINYDPNASEESIASMLQAIRAVEVNRIPQIGAMKVLVPAGTANLSRMITAVQATNADFQSVEENIAYHIDFVPNDPNYTTDQWGLQNSFAGIQAEQAWNIAKKDGAGAFVAVLDTGVDLQHPDLSRQVDKSRGWDFINDDNNPDDDDPYSGHGTHVAGIIAAKTNNAIQMAGIAFNAKIIPIKVCTWAGDCPVYEVAAGIVHATDRGAQVINLSLSGPQISTTVQGAVQYALSRNVTIVASAGESGSTSYYYPASFPGVISVVAHSQNGSVLPLSNQNDRITLSAPGVGIYSLAKVEVGGSGTMTGNSSATAHVSGVAALIYADKVATTPASVKAALICGAQDIGAAGYDNVYGYGMLKANYSLNWRENLTDCHVPQPNNLIENAILINRVPFTIIQPFDYRNGMPGQIGDGGWTYYYDNVLWYKLVPPKDDFYYINTYGSSFDPSVIVFKGDPGWSADQVMSRVWPGFAAPLIKGQIYYIMISSQATSDPILRLDVRAGFTRNNRDYQENSPIIAYSGTWERNKLKGASGGNFMQTVDDNATASFIFRGEYLEIGRTVGPDQGSMEVWVDNQLKGSFSNRASFTQLNVPLVMEFDSTFFTDVGRYHIVRIQRDSAGFAGPVTIDHIKAKDFFEANDLPLKVITGKTDDSDLTRILYQGDGWSQQAWPGSYNNTATVHTGCDWDSMFAKVSGTTITIYRHTGSSFGAMDVSVDSVPIHGDPINGYHAINNMNSSGLSVPWTISGLAPGEHVLGIRNQSCNPLAIDAIQGSNSGVLAPNRQYNATDSNIRYSEIWQTNNVPLAFGKKTVTTDNYLARADFSFNGNGLCIGFVRRPDGGKFSLLVDQEGVVRYYESISTNSDPNYWSGAIWPPDPVVRPSGTKMYCTGLAFSSGRHHAVMIFSSAGTPVELDFIYPGQFGVITPDYGVVPENSRDIYHTPFIFSDPNQDTSPYWSRIRTQSAGNYKPLGGYVKRTQTDGSIVRFYMNGSGFVLYTSVGPNAGTLSIMDCVKNTGSYSPSDWDCAPISIDGGSGSNEISLSNPHERPFAYAVTRLSAQTHQIIITAHIAPGQYVDFDAIRVMPLTLPPRTGWIP